MIALAGAARRHFGRAASAKPFRGARLAQQEVGAVGSRGEPREEARHAPRLRRADRLRVLGQPVAQRRRLVVDDVERPDRERRERGASRGRRILDVEEGEDAAARARDRDAAALHVGGEAAVRRVGRAGPVEVAVAEHHSVRQRADLRLERAHRGERRRERGRRVLHERIALDAQRLTRLVGEGDALRDEAAHALHGRCGVDQIARALGAHAVRGGEVARDAARVDAIGDRRELVDHRVGRRGRDEAREPRGVEDVPHHRLGPRRAQPVDLRRRPRERDDRVARLLQRGEQRTTDRSGGSGDEDAHGTDSATTRIAA